MVALHHSAWVVGTVTLVGVLWALPLLTYGQLDMAGIPEGTRLELDPPYPGPGEQVTVRLTSLRHELGGALISWAVDGEPVLDGAGEIELKVELGPVGTSRRIDYAVEQRGQLIDQGSRSITPVGLALVWEPLGYAPHFYKGQSLPTRKGTVRLIAIADFPDGSGGFVDPSTLTYTWKRGPQNLPAQSGTGRRSIVLDQEGYGGDSAVTLTVSDPRTGYNVRMFIRVPRHDPEVLAYEYDPLLGIRYERLLTSAQVEGGGLSLVAEPLSFSGTSRSAPNLNWSWSVGGRPVDADAFLQFSPTGDSERVIRSLVQLELRDTHNPSQRERLTIPISY